MHGRPESPDLFEHDGIAADLRADHLPDHATIDSAVDGATTAAARDHELPDAAGAESIYSAIPMGADLPIATTP